MLLRSRWNCLPCGGFSSNLKVNAASGSRRFPATFSIFTTKPLQQRLADLFLLRDMPLLVFFSLKVLICGSHQAEKEVERLQAKLRETETARAEEATLRSEVEQELKLLKGNPRSAAGTPQRRYGGARSMPFHPLPSLAARVLCLIVPPWLAELLTSGAAIASSSATSAGGSSIEASADKLISDEERPTASPGLEILKASGSPALTSKSKNTPDVPVSPYSDWVLKENGVTGDMNDEAETVCTDDNEHNISPNSRAEAIQLPATTAPAEPADGSEESSPQHQHKTVDDNGTSSNKRPRRY